MLKKIALVAVVTSPVAFDAIAQDSFFERNRYVAVKDRPQPEYDPVAIHVGAFDVNAELDATVGYRSNLFATDQNEVSDSFLGIRPVVDAVSTWSRHELGLHLEANSVSYADTDSENYTTYGTRAFGRIDAGSDLDLVGSASYEQNSEPRSAAARVANAGEPVEYSRTGAEVGADYEAGRLALRGRLSANDFNYDDVALNGGGSQDQDFRDNVETVASLRSSWAVKRDLAVFAEGKYITRDYDAPVAPNTLNRDADGYVIRGGANFELPALIRGDVAVGYQSFEYDDPTFSDVDGLSVEGNVQWFVTQLTTISANAIRQVIDPGIVNSAGATQTGLTVGVDHELRRNLIIGARADYAGFEFEGIDRDDDRYAVAVTTDWKLNRNLWLNATAEHINQESNQQPFSEDRLTVGVRIFP